MFMLSLTKHKPKKTRGATESFNARQLDWHHNKFIVDTKITKKYSTQELTFRFSFLFK